MENRPLTAEGIEFLKMPEIEPVDVWADKNRFISAARSSMPGRWRTSRTEYIRGIMRAIDDERYKTVVLVASTQVSKTELILNWFGRTFHQDAAPCMLVRPNITDARAFGATRLNEMIQSSPALEGLFAPLGARTPDGGVARADLRTYKGGQIDIVGSESGTGLASKPIKYLALDEVSRFAKSAGKNEGSPVALAMARLDSFEDAKCLAVSTPTDSSSCQITPMFRSGTMHRYFVPCEGCGHMEPYTFARLNRETASMVCSSCGMLNDESTKAKAIANGEWRSTRDDTPEEDKLPQDPECFSAHIWAAYSPFVSFEEIVRRHQVAKGNYDDMREFSNLTLGEVFEDESGQLKPAEVKDRTGTEDVLPDDRILTVTAGCDVQGDWLELVVYGWTGDGIGVGLDHRQFKGATNSPDNPCWQDLRSYVENFGIELADGRVMGLDSLAVDVGTSPDAPRDWITMMERVSTRTRFLPMKGSNDTSMRISNRGRANVVKRGDRSGRKIYWLGSQSAKHQIHAMLKTPSGQPNSFIFPEHIFGDAFFKGLLSEVLVNSKSRGESKRIWENRHNRRNEPLDCTAMAMSARGYLPGLRKLLETRKARREKWQQSEEGRLSAEAAKASAEENRQKIISEAAKTVPGYAPSSAEEKKTARQIVEEMPDQADDIKPEVSPDLPHRRARQTGRRRPPAGSRKAQMYRRED